MPIQRWPSCTQRRDLSRIGDVDRRYGEVAAASGLEPPEAKALRTVDVNVTQVHDNEPLIKQGFNFEGLAVGRRKTGIDDATL